MKPEQHQGRFDPSDAVSACLDRIARGDPVINAFRLVDDEGARGHAERLGRQDPNERGPLYGMPVGVKDLFDVAGLPTSAGSIILGANLAASDAALIERLRRAGAVVVGKTNMHEFAFGVTGVNSHHGDVRNPRDPARIAGGSSSGSAAAVAAGFCPAALGTDTGGSVRIPAALCGVVGFKPTNGMLPMRGVVPLSRTLDGAGYLARTVRQAAFMHHALAGGRPEQPRPLRIGVLVEWIERADPAVREATEHALDALRTRTLHRFVEARLDVDEQVFVASSTFMLAEAAAFHMRWLRTRLADYGTDVRSRLLQGSMIPAAAYIQAGEVRRWVARRLERTFREVDVLAGPTVPIVAPTFTEAARPETARTLVTFTRLANLVGSPAVSVPMPGDGLPTGLQLMAPPGQDALVLLAATEAERSLA